jgi:hypothetical protein
MLTKMTEEDWVLVHEVFDACRSRRGDKGRDDRKFLSGTNSHRSIPACRNPLSEPVGDFGIIGSLF